MRMREIATVRVRYGYRKILVLLQREGWAVGKTMVSRLYREEGLALRRTVPRKRRVAGVKIDFSRPGKPTDKGHIESFNGTFREECLNPHWFTTLGDARCDL